VLWSGFCSRGSESEVPGLGVTAFKYDQIRINVIRAESDLRKYQDQDRLLGEYRRHM
jgi:hypothetical protein